MFNFVQEGRRNKDMCHKGKGKIHEMYYVQWKAIPPKNPEIVDLVSWLVLTLNTQESVAFSHAHKKQLEN